MPVKKEAIDKNTKDPVVAVSKTRSSKVGKSAVTGIKVEKKVSLSVPNFSLAGKESGSLDLPKQLFGEKINSAILSQAMRVYLNNLKGHFSNTKTRGEVEGSTRKIYSQKGTGRARHGGIRAPIFVGGGIALGPKSRKVILELPKKMKKTALISALSQKAKDNQVFGLSGLDKATGKTKEMAGFIKKLQKKSVLIVADAKIESAQRSIRNLQKVSFLTQEQLNAFEVIKYQSLILTREAVDKLLQRLTSEKVKSEKINQAEVKIEVKTKPVIKAKIKKS